MGRRKQDAEVMPAGWTAPKKTSSRRETRKINEYDDIPDKTIRMDRQRSRAWLTRFNENPSSTPKPLLFPTALSSSNPFPWVSIKREEKRKTRVMDDAKARENFGQMDVSTSLLFNSSQMNSATKGCIPN